MLGASRLDCIVFGGYSEWTGRERQAEGGDTRRDAGATFHGRCSCTGPRCILRPFRRNSRRTARIGRLLALSLSPYRAVHSRALLYWQLIAQLQV